MSFLAIGHSHKEWYKCFTLLLWFMAASFKLVLVQDQWQLEKCSTSLWAWGCNLTIQCSAWQSTYSHKKRASIWHLWKHPRLSILVLSHIVIEQCWTLWVCMMSLHFQNLNILNSNIIWLSQCLLQNIIIQYVLLLLEQLCHKYLFIEWLSREIALPVNCCNCLKLYNTIYLVSYPKSSLSF